MVDNNKDINNEEKDTLLQGTTPVTEYDRQLIQSGVNPYPPSTPIPEAVPYPGVTTKQRLGYVAGIIPGLGMITGRGYRDEMQKRADMESSDISALKFFDKILEQNPRKAGELLKSPVFRDPFMRVNKATGEDIENLSSTLASKEYTQDEIIKIYGAGLMIDKNTKDIVPRPLSIEKEIAEENRRYKEEFEPAFLKKYPELDVFDAQLAWHRKKQSGNVSKGYQFKFPSGSTVGYKMNLDTGEETPIPLQYMQRMKYEALVDNEGNFLGMMFMPGLIPPDMKKEDIPLGVITAEQIMKDLPPEEQRRIAKDRRLWYEKVDDYLGSIHPSLRGMIPMLKTIKTDVDKEGDIKIPSGGKAESSTAQIPAIESTKQPAKSNAEEEANQYY